MRHPTLSISILSGKGGVGKSNIALNTAYGLNSLGNSVLLMDCDMGLANMDVLLGIAPQMHIQDIFLEGCAPEEVLVPIMPASSCAARGFDLLPANSGMALFTDLDEDARDILRERINPLAREYDFLLLDIGAGISPTALELGAMTDVRIVVVTPEPTSLTDSYALMKILSTYHKKKDFHILVNQVESQAESMRTFNRLAMVCQRFLDFSPSFLGCIHMDRAVGGAVCCQKPLLQVAPQSPAARDCMDIVAAIRHIHIQRSGTPGQEPLNNVRPAR